MEKFNRVLRGYDPDEVNSFLDQVISKVENMVKELDMKNEELKKAKEENATLRGEISKIDKLKEKLSQYERMEGTLNKAIIMAQKTSDQLKVAAHRESEIMIDDAKKNASRIVNEALMRAEKIENDAMLLKRNVNVFKRRLRSIIQSQLETIDEIDKIEL